MSRHARRPAVIAAFALCTIAGIASAQSGGVLVPVPPAESVTMRSDSFVGPDAGRHRLDVYRPRGASAPLPVMLFVNIVGPPLRESRGYVEWARLATTRGFAAVLYDGPTADSQRPIVDNRDAAIAFADSMLAHMRRRAGALGVDAERVVIWASSANTFAGTPLALSGARPGIRGYLLYYGAGQVDAPRLDVPVYIARAGLDAALVNRQLDSLAQHLVARGVAVTLANYPGGRHAFDLLDSTAVTAHIIDQSLDFAASLTAGRLHGAMVADSVDVSAASAFEGRRWLDASRLYGALARRRPGDATPAWRLGLAQLEQGEHAQALAAFARARENGQRGATELGIPAVRAAIRAGNTTAAVEWTRWTLRENPSARDDFRADRELAPMLTHPEVR